MTLRDLLDLNRNARSLALAAVYGGCLLVAFWLAYELRFDFAVPPEFARDRLQVALPVVGLQLGALLFARQFGTLLTYFSLPDLGRLVWAMLGSAALMMVWRAGGMAQSLPVVPRGVILINLVLGLAALCTLRLLLRVYRERTSMRRSGIASPRKRIAIVGAGDVGAALARELTSKPGQNYFPVVFFDDDPRKRGRIIHGIQVAGPPELAAETVLRLPFTDVVIAMPSAPAGRTREVIRHLTQAGFTVEMVPSTEQLLSGRVTVTRIRPVEVEDLLGRTPVALDDGAISSMIKGKVVMVTGAGGSIGSELCRQVVARLPQRLILVEQCEGALFQIEQELIGAGSGALIKPVIADICDLARMEQVFGTHAPQVVFHAAAHKHVFMMERQPGEAVKNNSFGTRALARMAVAHRVERFVLISTDKAINPTSVMGATKRLAEIALQELQRESPGGTRFIAVRFGNVLGSSGSVVPIFKRMIEAGGPVLVTHPEVTRYFMTIPESVGLVLQSAVLGEGGEIFVLDMGHPVKIVDLARQMIELSGFKPGEDIEIKFVGLKPGEKLYEELQHHSEEHAATTHPSIMRFRGTGSLVGTVDWWQELRAAADVADAAALKRMIASRVPEYTPFVE